MANQQAPMVPQSPETKPDGLSSQILHKKPSLEVEQAPAAPELEQKDVAQADVVREKLVSESAGLISTATTQQAQTTPQTPKPATMASMTPEDQIKHLVDLAHTSGLDHAFKVANATNNAYVIDRFHDELVNRVMHNKQQSM